MFCQTLVTEKSGMQAEDGTDILVANEWGLSKIQHATDQDILGTIARLALKQKELSKQDFALWQQAVGFNWNPCYLLHHQGLQADILPISQFLHDYMHCFLVTGIFQTTIWLLLASLEVAFGSIYPMVEQCLGNWILPASKKHLFTCCVGPSPSFTKVGPRFLVLTAHLFGGAGTAHPSHLSKDRLRPCKTIGPIQMTSCHIILPLLLGFLKK